jgi:hypothetical protein
MHVPGIVTLTREMAKDTPIARECTPFMRSSFCSGVPTNDGFCAQQHAPHGATGDAAAQCAGTTHPVSLQAADPPVACEGRPRPRGHEVGKGRKNYCSPALLQQQRRSQRVTGASTPVAPFKLTMAPTTRLASRCGARCRAPVRRPDARVGLIVTHSSLHTSATGECILTEGLHGRPARDECAGGGHSR